MTASVRVLLDAGIVITIRRTRAGLESDAPADVKCTPDDTRRIEAAVRRAFLFGMDDRDRPRPAVASPIADMALRTVVSSQRRRGTG